MLFKLTGVIILHLKLGNITCKLSTFNIPVGCDLTGIFKIQNGIKNWLLRQARRESLHAAVVDQLQLLQANGTVKNHVVTNLFFVHLIPLYWFVRVSVIARTLRGSSRRLRSIL